MKITALEDHKCAYCPRTIKKGEECLACMNLPEKPEKQEYEVLYVCMKCHHGTCEDKT